MNLRNMTEVSSWGPGPLRSGGPEAGAPADELLAEIAQFAHGLSLDSVPAAVRRWARLHLLDTIGLLHVGRATAQGTTIEQAVGSVFDPAAVPFGGSGTPSLRDLDPLSFLPLGSWIHVLEYDDTHLGAVVHPSCVLVPTLACMSRVGRPTADDIVGAYIAGVEVMVSLGLLLDRIQQNRPLKLSPTTAFGMFGAAVVAGRLLKLDRQQMTHALGIACGVLTGGLNFMESGGWSNNQGPGWAAVAGVKAAVFAARGVESSRRVFTGTYGAFAVMSDSGADPSGPLDLGKAWHFPDVTFKFVPGCHYIHNPIYLLHEALRSAGLSTFEDVESVEVDLSPHAAYVVCQAWDQKLAPRTRYEAFFSLPHMLGRSLAGASDIRAVPAAILSAEPPRGAVAAKDFAERLVVRAVDGLEGFGSAVSLKTKDGREYRHAEPGPVHPNHHLGTERLIVDKFEQNMTHAGHGEDLIAELRTRVMSEATEPHAADFGQVFFHGL